MRGIGQRQMSEDRPRYDAGGETTLSDTAEKWGQWAILEIMGHQRFVGFVTEEPLFGVNMARIDVPEVPAEGDQPAVPAYTKWFGGASVYSVTPIAEELAQITIRRYRKKPIDIYMPELYPPEPPTERKRLGSYPDEDDERDPLGLE